MHQRGFLVGRILGIPIRIHPSWFFLFLIIVWSLSRSFFPGSVPGQPGWHYWVAGVLGALLFFISLLLHELSHCVVAQTLRVPVLGITLFLFGGVSTMATDPDDAWKEIKIAAAGPLMSFLLAAFFVGAAFVGVIQTLPSPLVAHTLGYLGVVNLVLAVFNLVPGFPLDGGRVLRALWWLRTGSLVRATAVASTSGRILAGILISLGALQVLWGGQIQGLWLVLIGMFLYRAARSSYRDLQVRRLLEGIPVTDVLEGFGTPIPPETTVSVAAEEYFLRSGRDAFPVGEPGRSLGLLELRRLREVPREARPGLTVERILTPWSELPVVSWGDDVGTALRKMMESGRDDVVVTDSAGAPCGRISRDGIGRFLRNRQALTPDAGR
jgi:Zn-dependent protease